AGRSSPLSAARDPVVTGSHGLPGEDVTQFVRLAVRVPVKDRLKITPLRRGRVRGQLTLQLGAADAFRRRAGSARCA
ncbi:MAG TPA: hypothetical protein VEF71_23275, partial [Streptosporangiaceae bacterium]|nr:hypothetical protein [Streptosporangiaceae bacterium]